MSDFENSKQVTFEYNPKDPRVLELIQKLEMLQNKQVLRILDEAEQNVFFPVLKQVFAENEIKNLNDIEIVVVKLGKQVPEMLFKHYSPLSVKTEDFSFSVIDTFLEENRKSQLDFVFFIENPTDNKKKLEVTFTIKKNGLFFLDVDDEFGEFEMGIDLFYENKVNDQYFKSLSLPSQSSFKKIVLSAFQKLQNQFISV